MSIPIINSKQNLDEITWKKCGVVVQCREKSERLPEKWKLDLDGTPIIGHVMARAEAAMLGCRSFMATAPIKFSLCCAIPEGDKDLKEWLETHNYTVFEGEREDVLKRYYRCALEHNLHWIVRITGDCPLLEIPLASTIMNMCIMHNMDFVSNTIIRSYPDGYDVEVCSFRALQYLDENVRGADREHVFSWLYKPANQKKFLEKFKAAQFCGNIALTKVKISLDTQEDYEKIKEEYEKIKALKRLATHLGEEKH